MAAQLSGLTTYIIRAWESRYMVVEPNRTHGNQRVYYESDVRRLKLLANLVDKGHKISKIAAFNDQELTELIHNQTINLEDAVDYELRIERCLSAIVNLDNFHLKNELEEAIYQLGIITTIEEIITPLMAKIGEEWHSGRLSIFQEHLASIIISSIMGKIYAERIYRSDAPRVLVTTPNGQLHNLGSLSIAIAAAEAGFNVLYLGSNIPAEDVAEAANKSRAELIFMSIVFPEIRTRVCKDLNQLRRNIPDDTSIIVGGSSAKSFSCFGIYLGKLSLSEFVQYLKRNYCNGLGRNNTL